jgi:hypothetical protein
MEEKIMELIAEMKEWGDKFLPIERRVELLVILNKYLGKLRRDQVIAESIRIQSYWRNAMKQKVIEA